MRSVTSTLGTYMPRKITQEEFNAKVKANYGDTLDVSGFVYTRYNCRGSVKCPVHGEYEVSAQNLLKGFRCAKCYHDTQVGKFKHNLDEFVENARRKHGLKYDYSNTIYKGAKKKLTIRCRIHGEFEQEAWSHLSGRGCPACGDIQIGLLSRLTNDQFLERARSVHGDTYDLSLVNYRTSTDKIKVVCRTHGVFTPVAGNFISKKTGCPKCRNDATSRRSRLSFQEYVERSTKVHSGKFTYKELVYENNNAHLIVVCPTHGEFKQLAQSHLKGVGCVKCSKPVRDQASFLSASSEIHGDKYDYSKAEYKSAFEKVEIICPEHGVFTQAPTYHVNMANGCPRCAGVGPSNGQLEITEFLKPHVDVVSESRLPGSTKRLDILIPSKNLAVEYHGLIWHSTAFAPDPLRDNIKHKEAAELGVRVIHIYQDEWESKKDIVKRTLLSSIGALPKLFARKTNVSLIDNRAANAFYKANHLQGAANPRVSLGLYHDESLVAAMSFGMCRSIRTNIDKGLWELQRYAAALSVVGGAGRLLKNFLDLDLCHTLVSYSDNRLFSGNMYKELGFTLEHETDPDYCYVTNQLKDGRVHKSKFQRKHLPTKLKSFDPEKTEVENCFNNGWYQLFDCGKKKWILECK